VVELYYKSYSPELIAEKLETRSALAVKGMIERLQEIEIL
jgi:hypothetical protein